MADVLAEITTRLDAILRGGRGVSGLGADAAARAIPADRYRRGIEGALLRDSAYPVNGYDRAYAYEWGALALQEEYASEAVDRILLSCTLSLLLGHLYGTAHASFLRLVGGEVAATAATQGYQRALGDTVRIRRAICFGPLYQGGTEPPIVSIALTGSTTVEDLGDRLLTTIPLTVVINASNTLTYLP